METGTYVVMLIVAFFPTGPKLKATQMATRRRWTNVVYSHHGILYSNKNITGCMH
jgi:hypothetical protein